MAAFQTNLLSPFEKMRVRDALRSSGYEPRLDIAVYDSLLDLVERTGTELSDLKPRDRIDVQSFIWVLGNYKEDTEKPML